MCSCQAYGKSGVPNARGFCLVCGERVEERVDPPDDGPTWDRTTVNLSHLKTDMTRFLAGDDDPPDDGPLGVRSGTDFDGRDGSLDDEEKET